MTITDCSVFEGIVLAGVEDRQLDVAPRDQRAGGRLVDLRRSSVDNDDGALADHVERALQNDDRGRFVDADADQLRAISPALIRRLSRCRFRKC